MRYVAYAVWGVLVATLAVGGCHHAMASGGCGGCGETAADSKVVAQKNCPVMGGPIKKDIFVDHNGRRIYFCCNGCPDTFKKDPEKYLKIVDKQLKEAKPEGSAPGGHGGHAH